MALLTFHSERLDQVLKGTRIGLVRDGEVDPRGLQVAEVSRNDLLEALRLRGGVDDPREVTSACLERNGEISVVLRRE